MLPVSPVLSVLPVLPVFTIIVSIASVGSMASIASITGFTSIASIFGIDAWYDRGSTSGPKVFFLYGRAVLNVISLEFRSRFANWPFGIPRPRIFFREKLSVRSSSLTKKDQSYGRGVGPLIRVGLWVPLVGTFFWQ